MMNGRGAVNERFTRCMCIWMGRNERYLAESHVSQIEVVQLQISRRWNPVKDVMCGLMQGQRRQSQQKLWNGSQN